MSSKPVISIIAKQVQTLLKEVNTQLQLVITPENNGRFSVQNNIIVDYDKLTPEALQSMNEKLLGIYKELLDCVRVETMQPFPGANLASPSFIPDTPSVPPLWGMSVKSPYETFGHPDFCTFSSTNNGAFHPFGLSEEGKQQLQLANEFENKFLPGKCDYTDFYSTYFNEIENKDGAVYQLLLKPSFSETKFYTPIAETKNIATDKNFFNFFKFYTVSQLMIVEKV